MGKMISLEVDGYDLQVYVPDVGGPVKGGLIVIHEIWGLVDHIKRVADRFAAEGYIVVAPELLGEAGVTEELAGELGQELFDPQRRDQAQPKIRELMTPMRAPDFGIKTLARIEKCFDYLYDQPEVGQKVAVTGFCFGGSSSYNLAVHEPRLKACVPFYGHADFSVEQLRQIACPILAFYGEKDESLISALPKLTEDMKAAEVDYTSKVYPGCGHAFFNDTNPYSYNKEAAEDAFVKAVSFLDRSLI